MSQWGGRVSIVRHQTSRAAIAATRSPRSTGLGIRRASARTRAREAGTASSRVSSIGSTRPAGGRSALRAPQAQDREQERGEEDLDPDDLERGRQNRDPLLREASEPVGDPLCEDYSAEHDSGDRDAGSEYEAMLEAELGNAALEPGIAIAEVVHGVDATAESEAEQLSPDDEEERSADQRVDEERVPEQRGARENRSHRRRAHKRHQQSRSEEHTSELQSHHDLVCRLL